MTRIQVVQFKQSNVTLYSGAMTIGQLMTHAVTTEWNPELGSELGTQGYQRAPIPRHYLNIAEFLRKEEDPLLPTNALLASRNGEYGDLQFTSVAGDLGYLEIPENRLLFVVDYQHRWRGFKHAIEILGRTALREVMIPVTILSDAPLIEEMKQFYLINNKQKRVDTDLALTLMQAMSYSATEEELANLVGPGNKYRIRATRLVVQIAQLDSGPWAGKIQEPNVQSAPSQTASIKSFVDSLRPIVSARSPVYNFSDHDLVNILMSVWTGVLDLWPEWKTNSNQYAIQGAIGLFVIHRVARELLIPGMLASGDRSAGLVTTMLSPQKRDWLSPHFWRTGGDVGTWVRTKGTSQQDRSFSAPPHRPLIGITQRPPQPSPKSHRPPPGVAYWHWLANRPRPGHRARGFQRGLSTVAAPPGLTSQCAGRLLSIPSKIVTRPAASLPYANIAGPIAAHRR